MLLVISLLLTAMVRNLWQFAAVYGVLVPIGLAGTGPVIASGLVARWFSKRRGTATESGTAREACSALVTSPGNSSGLLRRATPPY